MPRTKETRNPLGSIFTRTITKNGKKIKVYDARKRYVVDQTEDGKPIYKDRTKRCLSYADATTALLNFPVEIEEELKQKKTEKTREHTFFELCEYYRTEYVKPAVYSGKRKIAGYRQNLKTLGRYIDEFKEFFGDVPVSQINYQYLRRFAVHLATTKTKRGDLPAASTYHKKLTVLQRMFSIAIQMDWVLVSPFKRGEPLIKKSAEQERNRMLTYEEEERLLAACVDGTFPYKFERYGNTYEAVKHVQRSYLRPYIFCSLDAAMRRGEIFEMRWWQVDFDNRVIYLTKDAAAKTKTGAEGILPLTARLADELLKIKNSLRRPPMPNDYVLGKCEFKRAFSQVCKDAGITDLQFRDLRATGATRMQLSGTVANLVKKVTRHSKVETLHKHYTLVDMRNAQEIGDRLDEYNQAEKAKVRASMGETIQTIEMSQ